MLDLDDPRWSRLSHAYGSASDVPGLIRKLETAPPPEGWQDEPWFSVWSALCHQSDVYDASYAAIPHVVAIASAKPKTERLENLHFVASVEAFRHREGAPPIPTDLEEAYREALERAAALIFDCLRLDWNEQGYKILLGGLAVVRGEPRLGNAIAALAEDSCACPKCGTMSSPPGYDLF